MEEPSAKNGTARPSPFRTPSYVGEAAAVVAVIGFLYWALADAPRWVRWLSVAFVIVFIIDWMLGGIADKGICRECFGKGNEGQQEKAG